MWLPKQRSPLMLAYIWRRKYGVPMYNVSGYGWSLEVYGSLSMEIVNTMLNASSYEDAKQKVEDYLSKSVKLNFISAKLLVMR